MEQNIQALIDKYLAGRCTPEEEEAVHAWLEQVDRPGREWSAWPADKQKDYLSSLYDDIRGSLREREKHSRRRTFRLYLLRAAASLALLACFSLLIYYYGTRRPGPEQPPGYVLAETPAGNVREIRLNDGSVVWLNAASSFSYPREFSGGTREVFLEGEAFFSVARDTSRPFIIHTAEMETRVLGTSFNVKAYRDSEDMQVTVVSGEVEVSIPSGAGKEAVLLQPRQMATYEREEGLLSKTSVGDVAPYEEWKEGRLVFNLTSMEEVATTLERAFGLNIKIENPAILRCKITGRFSRNQSADLTIEAICKSIGARYTIRGDKVTIAGEGCEN